MRPPHVAGHVCLRHVLAVSALAAFALVLDGRLTAQQVIPGNNVNMVSGTEFPTGDPFLQRQNEPSLAVSTRNPLHLLAGSNDYRTVDLPGPFDPLRGEKMNADAWLGLFKSFDGGRTWQSTLLPGYPQDNSLAGSASPIKGRQAGTDPVVRAGTNGLFYYAGLAFDRGENAPSTIFVSRFIDLNNRENGDPIEYLGTQVVDSNTGTRFLDKTALAVDVPRNGATCTITTPRDDGTLETQTIPAGPVYVAYSSFTGTGTSQQSQIMFSRSLDCGVTWSAPKNLSVGNILNQNAQIAISPSTGHIWVSWRRFVSGFQTDGIFISRSIDGGATFSRAVRVAPVFPFDQGTTDTSFRSNSFQTMTVDAAGRAYVAWPQRGHAVLRPDRATGDARIVVSTSTNGSTWTAPVPLSTGGLGHQIMPAISFHGGKLRLIYYDLQEDVSQIFGQFIDELPILTALDPKPPRHTIDVFVAQAAPAAQPVFTPARLSDYAFGTIAGSPEIQRLQYNPPNLPLFRQGTAPFMGDYIDLASAPPFVRGADGVWRFNTEPTTAAVSHGIWTDNRDVRAPADGNWTNYTPVTSDSVGTQSLFDPSQMVPPCSVGQTGMRNQNIYTAKVTEGLFVGAPGNTKPLGLFPRAFVIIVENARAQSRSYRLQILNQPPGGQASFQQFETGGVPLTTLDATVPPFSTIARTVHVSSSEVFAQVSVSVSEIAAPGAAAPVPGGQSSIVVLNGDQTNPSIQNPSIQNPSIQNPDIQVAEAYNPAITAAFVAPSIQNPSIQNPSIQNPSIQNPSIQNPSIQNDAIANPGIINPSIQNPSIQNPSIQNPSIQNPSIQNQDLVNGAIQDTTWVVSNDGNTTASYAIKLLINGTLPDGFRSQLVLHKNYNTPAAQDCTLALQPHTILLANIPDPAFTQLTDVANPSIQNPSIQNATLSLAPGESANVTLRIVDPNRFDGVAFDAGAAIAPATVAHSVNTADAAQGVTTPRVAIPLTITTGGLAAGSPGGAYFATLQTFAASGTTSWTVTEGALPPGVTLDPATGQISGTPTTPGNYVFSVQAVDSNGNVDRQTLAIKIDPVVPAGFSRAWNGADTNWANPSNWSPAGVPLAADRVYISAAIQVVPTLTRDETIQDLFLEPGATVNTNGFRLTTTRNADAGHTIVGAGATVLTADGGSASGVFSNLEITGRIILGGAMTVTGNLTLGNGARLYLNGHSLIVGGQLVSTPPGQEVQRAIPAIFGPASIFIVSGVAVDGLLLQGAPLTINGGTLSLFDNVLLNGFAPEAVQLTVSHAGTIDSFAMNGISFSTLPTTGRLIQANDTADDANTLVLNVFGAVPADGTANTATSGGAIVNWLSNPGDANLAVVQTVSPNPAPAGSVLTYTILVTNGGPSAATSVSLSPGVPFGTTGVVLTTTQGECTDTSGNYSCQLGTIAAGASATVTAAYVVPGIGTVFRTASVSGSEPDPAPGNNSHTIGVTLFDAGSGVNLSLTKSDSADPVAFGAPFTYSLVVTNSGTTPATNVLVVDPIPAGVTIAAPETTQGTCSIVSGQVLCSVGVLPPGQSVTITLPATAAATGIVSNAAFVTSSEVELSPLDNSATQQTAVVETAGCSAVTFTGPVSYQGSPGPTAVVRLVDMDHDGDLDAVATHETNGGGVDVFLNDGTGQFGPPRFTSTVTGPWIHVVADFNGDTHPDVITSSDRTAVGNPLTLRLLTNDGTGTLTLSPTFSIPFGGHLDALDMDRDGDQDLVIITTSGDLALLRNDGAANFGAPVTILAAPAGGFPAFGDFNGDNHTDAAIGLGATGYAVVLADGAGAFLPPVVHAVDGGAHGVAAADLNGDGRLDLLIVEGGEESPSPQSSVVLGDGTGGFGPAVEVVSGSFVYFPTLTDVNGDGRIDLVAISGFNAFAVRLGNGAGGFSAPVEFPNAIYYGPAVGDLNGDGRPDIAIGDRNGQLHVFLNNCGAAATNLGVTVSESADPVNEGEELTYTVTLTNHTGTEAAGVRVTSVLSPQVSDDPEEPNVEVLATTSSTEGATLTTASNNTFTWTLPTLAPNGTVTFEFRLRPLGGATLVFTTGVTSDGAETDSSDNAASASTTVAAIGRTIAVTNTNDSGPGSLRQAIIESNDPGDVDTIVFNIGAGGPQTIVPLSQLPEITQPVIIDGATQPGFAGAPIVELNGNGLGDNGLFITGGNTTVRALVINRFGQNGILITGGGGNVIEGNFIGLDSTGTLARPNRIGVAVLSGGNRVGGTTPEARNVISGNQLSGVGLEGPSATGNLVQGNYIGTNALGTAAVANGGGIFIGNSATTNTVGGLSAGAGNVISGNAGDGITIQTGSTATRVQGNRIGTNAAGTGAVPNTFAGVRVNAASTVVGGTVPEARNIISGNTQNGVVLGANSVESVVQGNHIGTNPAGTAAIPNNQNGVLANQSSSTIIGGTQAGAGNLISGNTLNGVNVTQSLAIAVQGNRIGVNAAGIAALPNGSNGVNINSSDGISVGGTESGAGNVISGNTLDGVVIGGASESNSVRGNLIGTDATGTAAIGNRRGVVANAEDTTVGGTTVSARNVISGNRAEGISIGLAIADGTQVQGNYIGTNVTGTGALPNSIGVVVGLNTTGVLVGGTAAGAGNLISGNTGNGITVTSSVNATVQGNLVGTDASGAAALPNGNHGISIGGGATGTQIGGTAAGARNVISGNQWDGIFVIAPGPSVIQGNLIGTNAGGTAALPNRAGIALVSAGTTVGGTTVEARNIISGNNGDGILISGATASGNTIQGNYIGTNAAGTAAIGNQVHGVAVNAAPNNVIGGSAAGNVISGNVNNGVGIFEAAASGNRVEGNRIGTNAAATGILPNMLDGVGIVRAPNNVVAANLVAGNGRIGVGIFEDGATGNVVQSNLIGTTGANDLGNGSHGVFIGNGAANDNTVGGTAAGEGNIIAFNGGNGISVAVGTGNRLSTNSIFGNDLIGIDLGDNGPTPNDAGDGDAGANNLQNFPVLTSAISNGATLIVQGTLDSAPNTTFRIELFASAPDPSGFGEGATPLGFVDVTTDGSGAASFTTEVPGAGVTSLTATATDPNGNTSEFSSNLGTTLGPQIFVVTNTNDSGAGSLRAALLSANGSTGTRDTIAFNIPGSGPHHIVLQSALPMITDSVVIDGTTEPDFSGNPVVEVDGSALPDPYGLHITAGNSVVRGLVISGFGAASGSTNGVGIVLEGNGGNLVEGNFIGTDVTGLLAKGNLNSGIQVTSDGNVIGGTTAAARNVISGNINNGVLITSGADNNAVVGNNIGVDRTGAADLGNGLHGVQIFASSSNTIGGPTAAARNVISGNTGHGVLLISASNNAIQGNYVGTNAAGTADVGNTQDGINIQGNNNAIGGTAPGAGNVVSGNNQVGIIVQNGSNNSIAGNQVGVNAAGTAALGNSIHGVVVAGGATGTGIQGNVISGNTGDGVFLSGANGSSLQGNFIGTASDGSTLIPNQANGVSVSSSSTNTIGRTLAGAGTGNVIAGNGFRGIAVQAPASNNVIFGNSIFSNGLLGIDLGVNGVTANDTDDTDTGANGLQNYPVLTRAALSATQIDVDVTFNSVAGRAYSIEFFRSTSCNPSGFGEGATPAGVTTLGVMGNATTQFTASFGSAGFAVGQFITATATSSDGTSEFSACIAVADQPSIDAPDASAAELGPDTATLVLSRGSGETTTADRLVQGTLSGTAVLGVDYTLSAPGGVATASGIFEVTIPAGQTSVTVTVTPIFDPAIEGPETAIFSVPGSSVTVTIADEPAVSTVIEDASAAELGPDNGTFTVTRGGAAGYDRLVQGTISGTAVRGEDYSLSAPGGVATASGIFEVTIPAGQTSVTVTVTPIFDPAVEGPETAIFTVEGTPVTVTIADEPAVSTVIEDASAAELGPDTAAFTVTRGGAAGYDRLVQGTIGGTAAYGFDYLLSAPGGVSTASGIFEVMIPAGQASVTVTLTPTSDGVVEGPESAIFTVEGSSVTITIADEPPPAVEHLWTGAADTNWSNGANWSPATTPRAIDSARIAASAPRQPTLTADTSITNLLVEAGASVNGGGFRLTAFGNVAANGVVEGGITLAGVGTINGTIGGDTEVSGTYAATGVLVISGGLSVTGTFHVAAATVSSDDFETVGSGIFTMHNAVGTLAVADANLAGGQSILNEGTMFVRQAFSQRSGTTALSFRAEPAHTVVFNGDGEQTILFESPASSQFGRLVIAKSGGTVPLASDVRLAGALDTLPGSPAVFTGTGQLLSTVAPNVNGAVFDNVRLFITGDIARLDDVVFRNFDPTATQLSIAHPGAPNPFTLNNLSFLTTPSTGFYIQAQDTSPVDDWALIINLPASQPVDGSAHTLELNGARVNWSGVIGLSLVDTSVVGVGRQATLRVTLPFAAPPEGVTVTVTSGDTNLLTVGAPGTVSIGAGQTIGEIVVNGIQSGTVTVTAAADGYRNGTLPVSVTQNLISTPATLNVPFGQSTDLPVTIGPNAAPPGGFTVDVVSSDATVIEVITPQLTIPEGAFSANATVRGARIGTANVTVTNPNYSPSTTSVTSRAELNILQTSASFSNGLTPPELTVQLESNGSPIAAQPALTVTLTSANTACVTVPASVTIANGLVTTTFSPAYGGTATLPCTTTITASAPDVVNDTVSITVNPPPGITASGTLTVGAGLMLNASATLGATQHGGRDVTVTSNDPSVLVSPDAETAGTASFTRRINNGQTSVPYYVQGLENTTGAATVTISADGFTPASHTVNVAVVAVEISSLQATTTTLSAHDTTWYVQVGVRNPAGMSVVIQNVRPGGPAFVVTLTNSNGNVARLRSDEPTATGQVVTKPIQPGVYYTQAIAGGTTFGLAFEPLSSGTTTVSVTGPAGVLTTTNSTRQVEVTAPVITAPGTQIVGAGLLLNVSATLGASQHGGRDVTVASNDPAVMVSPDAATQGTASFTRRLDNGQTSFPYYVQGLENTTRSATVTISADGFTPASHTVNVAAVAVEIQSLQATTTTLSAHDTTWYVQVGVPNQAGTAVSAQNLRPGGPAFVVTLTNSNGNVARLRSDEPTATGQVVTKPIQPGVYYTQAIASGTTFGLAFEPLAEGTTAVSVTGPAGVFTTTNSTRQVTVNAPAITATSTLTVGAGLMLNVAATLGASQHGGRDVTVTSNNAAVLVSPDATTPGTTSFTRRINNGQTSFPYYVQGLENTTGAATVTISAQGFTSASHTVNVAPVAVEIHGLNTATTNLSPDDTSWYVQVGVPNQAGTAVSVQNLRPGGPAFVVTLVNSNGNVARLRSDEPAATGQVVTKPIQPGVYYTQAVTTGTTYGLAFEPLSNGTTTVSVTGPAGVLTTTNSARQVEVTTPAISVAGSTTVGAGLQQGVAASLGASQHGGVDVTITSSASLVMVSPNSTTAGSSSITVRVNDGSTSIPFYVQGLENTTGTAIVTLSAPGFISDTMSVTVAQSAVEISNLVATTTAGAVDYTSWYAQVGVRNAGGTGVSVQSVRAGGPVFVVTLNNSNGTAARLRSDEPAATGQTVTKPIQPAFYYSQAAAPGTNYGLAFDPLAAGTTQVSVTGPPGVGTTTQSTRTVVINP